MEALQAALASLVALEARAVELVSPVEAIAEAVKTVVKEAAIVVESLHGRVTELEDLKARVATLVAVCDDLNARVAAIERHPAVSVPALTSATLTSASPIAAAAPSAPLVDAASEVHDASSDVSSAPAAAPVTAEEKAVTAPDLLSTFGFDKPEAVAGSGT